jgi:hypothetical protein
MAEEHEAMICRDVRSNVGCITERIPMIRDLARIVTPIPLRRRRHGGS